MHAVLRVTRDVGRLWRGEVLDALRRAISVVRSRRDEFRVVHYSLQHNHLHLLVEAAGNESLAKGMQAFAISAARAINRVIGRTGRVFEHRFHSTVIGTPRQARNVLAYVLGNWRRHHEDERSRQARTALLDPYSSAVSFDGWRQPTDWRSWPGWARYEPVAVTPPETWLLSTGWKRVSPALDAWSTPGPLR